MVYMAISPPPRWLKVPSVSEASSESFSARVASIEESRSLVCVTWRMLVKNSSSIHDSSSARVRNIETCCVNCFADRSSGVVSARELKACSVSVSATALSLVSCCSAPSKSISSISFGDVAVANIRRAVASAGSWSSSITPAWAFERADSRRDAALCSNGKFWRDNDAQPVYM